ncbi:hypothetical protein ACFLRF_01675 [Candidatus Altiarchaeota archaeon]
MSASRSRESPQDFNDNLGGRMDEVFLKELPPERRLRDTTEFSVLMGKVNLQSAAIVRKSMGLSADKEKEVMDIESQFARVNVLHFAAEHLAETGIIGVDVTPDMFKRFLETAGDHIQSHGSDIQSDKREWVNRKISGFSELTDKEDIIDAIATPNMRRIVSLSLNATKKRLESILGSDYPEYVRRIELAEGRMGLSLLSAGDRLSWLPEAAIHDIDGPVKRPKADNLVTVPMLELSGDEGNPLLLYTSEHPYLEPWPASAIDRRKKLATGILVPEDKTRLEASLRSQLEWTRARLSRRQEPGQTLESESHRLDLGTSLVRDTVRLYPDGTAEKAQETQVQAHGAGMVMDEVRYALLRPSGKMEYGFRKWKH